jgi:hypothetical protein
MCNFVLLYKVSVENEQPINSNFPKLKMQQKVELYIVKE